MGGLIGVPGHSMRAVLLASTVVVGLVGCNRDKATPAVAVNGGSAGEDATAAQAVPDPCTIVSAADVAGILGPLTGAPTRGSHFDNPEPDGKGFACVYTLAARPAASSGGNTNTVSVELRLDDAVAHESGFRAGTILSEQVRNQVTGEKQSPKDTGVMTRSDSGWDYNNALPDEFFGRLGHLGVAIGVKVYPPIAWDKIERLAVLVRDRVPDRPFMSIGRRSHGGGDPCKLLTQHEAEAVLGKLAVPPYRSTEESPLVDAGGAGCSYYSGKHHVFTIKPEWDMGKQLFSIAAGTSQKFGSVITLPTESADTLEGPWDQAAAGTDGTLYFLKGDKMLTVVYHTAAVDLAGAVKLVNIAIKRL